MSNGQRKRSKAINKPQALSKEDRQILGQAIIEGLVNPVGFDFINPLASEGGDYDQNGGSYTQSGGGTHDQGGTGDYNQSAAMPGFGSRFVRPRDVVSLVKGLDALKG